MVTNGAVAKLPECPPDPRQLDELVVELQPRRSALTALGGIVDAFGVAHGLSEFVRFRLILEIDELLTNYVTHRRPSARPSRMELRVRVFSGRVDLVVIDSGPAFDPQAVPPLAEVKRFEDIPARGLGIHLVRNAADRLCYRQVAGNNLLRLEHDLVEEDDA